MSKKHSIFVKAPSDSVFDYLSDVSHHGDWAGDSNFQVGKTSEGPVEVGATFKRRGRPESGSEREESIIVKVVEFDPHLRLAFETQRFVSDRGPEDLTAERGTHLVTYFELNPSEMGTEVVKWTKTIPDEPRSRSREWVELALLAIVALITIPRLLPVRWLARLAYYSPWWQLRRIRKRAEAYASSLSQHPQ